MIDDRNKTEITKLVTAAAYRYLDERGFKPVETEVPVADGWVADLAGVINPTETELQELKLVSRKPRWKTRVPGQFEAWQAEVEPFDRLMTCLVEVKTSMSDFRGDKKWSWLAKQFPANLAYIAIPKSLPLERSEFPLSWGVLEYEEPSDTLKCIQAPELWAVAVEQQLNAVLSIAIRRDHHTRYEREREFRREITVRHNEDVSRTRMSKAIRAVAAIVSGHSMSGRIPHTSIKEALEYHGIKHVSHYDMELLADIWATHARHPTPTLTESRDPDPVLCEEERRKEKD